MVCLSTHFIIRSKRCRLLNDQATDLRTSDNIMGAKLSLSSYCSALKIRVCELTKGILLMLDKAAVVGGGPRRRGSNLLLL